MKEKTYRKGNLAKQHLGKRETQRLGFSFKLVLQDAINELIKCVL